MVLLTRKDTTKNAVAKGRTLSAMFVLRAISQHHPGGARLRRNKGEATKQTPCRFSNLEISVDRSGKFWNYGQNGPFQSHCENYTDQK